MAAGEVECDRRVAESIEDRVATELIDHHISHPKKEDIARFYHRAVNAFGRVYPKVANSILRSSRLELLKQQKEAIDLRVTISSRPSNYSSHASTRHSSAQRIGTSPPTVFYSYSHKDESFRDKLQTHLALLKRQGLVNDWHDRQIPLGKEWVGEIDEHLNKADIILLLVSSDFLASEYCFAIEMTRAMERHAAGEAVVIPIILKPCDWKSAPFGKLQGVPKNAKPVTKWSNRDEAFLDISTAIREVVNTLHP